jgi:glycosyltransferase involved in cell wall biosynthesis
MKRAASADITILSSAHDLADARLHRLCRAFVDAGLVVEVIARGSAASVPAGAAHRATSNGSGWITRVRIATKGVVAARGKCLVTLDPELVPLGLLWRILSSGLLVVDVHEDYEALLQDREWARGGARLAASLLVRIATVAAERADLTVVADVHLPPHRARRRMIVRNLPAPGEIGRSSRRRGARPPRAVYVGDVRESRGLSMMVAAISNAPSWELDIIGPISGEDASWLHRQSLTTPRIRVHGRLSKEKAWDIACGADVGLCMLSETPAFRAAMPTKIYEYLAGGLAVLATPLPRVAQLLNSSGAGQTVASAEEAASALRRWEEDASVLDQHRAAARSWALANLTGPSPFESLAHEVFQLLRSEGRSSS